MKGFPWEHDWAQKSWKMGKMAGLGAGRNVHSDWDNHHTVSSEPPGYAGVNLQVGGTSYHPCNQWHQSNRKLNCETLSLQRGMLGKKVGIQRRTSRLQCGWATHAQKPTVVCNELSTWLERTWANPLWLHIMSCHVKALQGPEVLNMRRFLWVQMSQWYRVQMRA